MPVHQGAAIWRGKIARAEHCVGALSGKRHEQRGDVRGVVFEVGIMNDAYVARGPRDGGAYGRALPLIMLVAQERQAVLLFGKTLKDMPAAVGAAIVNHD